ncbi:MAG: hypothetical protein ACP5E4_01980 [Candidatus Aenigmatarchaeota archaeon]
MPEVTIDGKKTIEDLRKLLGTSKFVYDHRKLNGQEVYLRNINGGLKKPDGADILEQQFLLGASDFGAYPYEIREVTVNDAGVKTSTTKYLPDENSAYIEISSCSALA